MKRTGKLTFFVVAFLIVVLTYLSFFGLKGLYGDQVRTYVKSADDIRWGIDIRGGVDVTFSPPEGVEATADQINAAAGVIRSRLVLQGITDNEVYSDINKNRIIVRFPWKVGETDFDPQKAIAELGDMAMLTFREGVEFDQTTGAPIPLPDETVILQGVHVKSADLSFDENNNPCVGLSFTPEGTALFATATAKLAPTYGIISIWMDNELISYPSVNNSITDGNAVITGNFTIDEARTLARQINSGALPFKLEAENFSTISPSMGIGARDAMVLGGIVAFALVVVFMISVYRLPGLIASIALLGQVAGSIAALTRLIPLFPSFTLTLPGIAGVILSIGMGVDANVITNERIKEELRSGRSLDSSIDAGFENSFSAIFDGNITMIFVAIVLMGAFGTSDGIFAKLLSPIFFMFGPSTEGSIYSFGYTLFAGIFFNFVMGVTASRLMLKSLSRFKPFRNIWLYGGKKDNA